MTVLATDLARTAALIEFAAIPERAVDQAKWALVDVVGVSVAALDTTLGHGYLAYLARWGGPGPATVIGAPGGHAPRDAAWANGSLAHVLDFDDRGHASTHLFAAALAAGELAGADGRTLLRAYVLAREARIALDQVVDEGRMDGGGPGSRGWHSTGVNGPIASAMAAALVLGLEPEQTAMAMGMAASASSGLIANFGTGTKPLHAGRAAASGVEAALLVAAGIDSDPAAIDGQSGLFEALGVDRDRAAATVRDRYGTRWDLVERGVRIKPWPSCTTTHAAIETAARIHREHGRVPIDRVARLRLDLRPFMLRRLSPAHATAARFNMAHGILTALDSGAVTRHDFDDARIARLESAGVFARVEHVAGSKELAIELTDGSVIRETIDPQRDLAAPGEVEAKFHECAAAWEPARREAVIAMLRSIEDVADLGASTSRADRARIRWPDQPLPAAEGESRHAN